MKASRPMTHSAPMRAPVRTWARCQMLVRGPTVTSGLEVGGRVDARGGIDHVGPGFLQGHAGRGRFGSDLTRGPGRVYRRTGRAFPA